MAIAIDKRLEVAPREAQGKSANRRLRAEDKIPGSVYGLDRPPFSVAVPRRRIEQVLHLASGRNTLIQLSLEGTDRTRDVMIRELQRDPVNGKILHVDFMRIDPNVQVEVRVPIHLVGTPEGVKNEGGVLDFVHREVEVACLPSAIPEHFDVDVNELHLNQHVSVRDLQIGEGVRLLEEADTIIAVVAISRAEVSAEGEEEEVAEVEPQVADDSKEEGEAG